MFVRLYNNSIVSGSIGINTLHGYHLIYLPG